MRYLLCLVFAALLLSCHSNKEVQQSVSVASDSIATVSVHRTFFDIDSVYRHISLSFDTLSLTVKRSVADTAQSFRLRAVRGNLSEVASQNRLAVEHKSRLDSTALLQSSDLSSEQHTASTALYKPPDMTAVICVALPLVALLIFLLYRKKQ